MKLWYVEYEVNNSFYIKDFTSKVEAESFTKFLNTRSIKWRWYDYK